MRTTRSHKTTKKNYRQTIHKRRYKSKSTETTCLGCSQTLPNFDLENINEVLRVHKTNRAEGKGSWKIVPKDSCEVYKERRKRQAESGRNEECTDDNSMITTDSENNAVDRKRRQKKTIEKKARNNPRRKSRPRRLKAKTHRRTKQPSASTSRSTTSRSTYSSCFSSSEMDE